MKKVFLLLCLLATTNIMMATDLWEGTHAVAWDNTLTIEAAKFAEAQVGQKIVVEFTNATGEVIELHSNGGMLPGTRYAHFLSADQHEMEVFITPGMLASLKEYGMEVCGTGFTATKLWYGDGKDNVDENTVWTGYFWMEEWSTLEIAKTSFDGINWSDYKSIRFYSEANRTDYVINVLTKWGDGGMLGDQTTMTMTTEYAELNLEDIDMAAKLADVDRLMVQCNKEGEHLGTGERLAPNWIQKIKDLSHCSPLYLPLNLLHSSICELNYSIFRKVRCESLNHQGYILTCKYFCVILHTIMVEKYRFCKRKQINQW